MLSQELNHAPWNAANDKTFTTDHLRQAMRDVEHGGETGSLFDTSKRKIQILGSP